MKYLRTLEMLVAIYFPNLQPHLDKLHLVRGLANEIMNIHKEEYRARGPHKSEALGKMQALSKELSAIEGDFRAAVRKEADKINKKIQGGA